MDHLNAWLKAEMKRLQLPGLSVGVAREGQGVLAPGYGWANVERAVPATAEPE